MLTENRPNEIQYARNLNPKDFVFCIFFVYCLTESIINCNNNNNNKSSRSVGYHYNNVTDDEAVFLFHLRTGHHTRAYIWTASVFKAIMKTTRAVFGPRGDWSLLYNVACTNASISAVCETRTVFIDSRACTKNKKKSL